MTTITINLEMQSGSEMDDATFMAIAENARRSKADFMKWIWLLSDENEKSEAFELANTYIRTDEDVIEFFDDHFHGGINLNDIMKYVLSYVQSCYDQAYSYAI